MKNSPSSDCSLQLENMKQELLVIANHQVAVNVSLGLVHTARHAMGVGTKLKVCLTICKENLVWFLCSLKTKVKVHVVNPELRFDNHGEVVTW